MNYIVAAATDIGLTKKTNQDSYSAKVFSCQLGKIVFAIVCDGMGGLSKGEIASATVVRAFRNWAETRLPVLCSSGFDDSVIKNDWTELVNVYNEKIKIYGKKSGISLGTTLTAILLTENRYYLINVGDSRTYEITDSVRLLTKDQTVVAREVEQGILTEEQAKVDPRRSVLLQCIGASDQVFPDIFFGTTAKDAVYMLCSDGFVHEITPGEMYQYLCPQVMTDVQLMELNMRSLINLDKQRAERDNITVLTVRTF